MKQPVCETTVPEDKPMLEESVQQLFPKGILGFDALLIQASLIGELYFEKRHTLQSQAAVDQAEQEVVP